MAFISPRYLLLAAIALATYWAYTAWQQLETRRRAKQFQLDQRRKAGIPDSDKRPFGIARADAIKKRNDKVQATRQHRQPSAFKPSGMFSLSSPLSQRPFTGLSPPKPSLGLSGIPDAQPGYLRNRSSYSKVQQVAEPKWPGSFDEGPDFPRFEFTNSPPPTEEPVVWSSPPVHKKHMRSDSESCSGSETAGASKKTRKMENDSLERKAMRTSKKRGPTEARDETDDSVAGDRSIKRRNKAEPLRPNEDQDESMETLQDMIDDDDQEMKILRPAPVSRGKKRGLDTAVDSQTVASSRAIRGKKRGKATPAPEYELEDAEMASLSDFGADRLETDKESLRQFKGKRKADTSNDREPGEEWTDLNGLRWKIDEDGVRRRATVVVEMRPKYNMPKDSQHPDAKQKIQVYVERFLSGEEYEEAKKKKQLGFQEAERQREAEARVKAEEEAAAKAAEAASAGRTTLTPKRLRNNDLLYSDNLVHPSPLRASRSDISLHRSAFGTPPRLGSTPLGDEALNSAGGKSRRISLAASNSAGTSRTNSPRVTPSRRSGLDDESKKRREEALLKKLREEKEKSATPAMTSPTKVSFAEIKPKETKKETAPAKTEENKPEPLASASFSFGKTEEPKKVEDKPAAPSFSFGASAEPKKVEETKQAPPPFSFGDSTESKKPDTKPASSFSFGAPAAESKKTEAKPAVAASFSFGTPSAENKKEEPKPASSFSFGAPAEAKKPELKSTPFSFGTSDAKPAASFSFGAPAAGPKPSSFGAPSEPKQGVPSFSFGAPSAEANKPEAKPASSFSFGATSEAKTSPSFSFVEPAKKEATFSFGGPTPPSSQQQQIPSSFTFGSSTPSSSFTFSKK